MVLFNKDNLKVYLAPGEIHPYRCIHSKHFIPKAMFITVVARPRYNNQGVCTFDGKCGTYAFTYTEPAKRRSKNRARGTPITKPIASVTAEVFQRKMLEEVLPGIREKWPTDSGKTIIIRADNATPHVEGGNPEFL